MVYIYVEVYLKEITISIVERELRVVQHINVKLMLDIMIYSTTCNSVDWAS